MYNSFSGLWSTVRHLRVLTLQDLGGFEWRSPLDWSSPDAYFAVLPFRPPTLVRSEGTLPLHEHLRRWFRYSLDDLHESGVLVTKSKNFIFIFVFSNDLRHWTPGPTLAGTKDRVLFPPRGALSDYQSLVLIRPQQGPLSVRSLGQEGERHVSHQWMTRG